MDPVEGIDDAAMTRTMVSFGNDAGTVEGTLELDDGTPVFGGGAPAIATGDDRADGPRRERRHRTDGGEQREQQLAEHGRQDAGAERCDTGADQRRERRGMVDGRSHRDLEWRGRRAGRRDGSSPHDPAPGVAFGGCDAAGRDRAGAGGVATDQEATRADREGAVDRVGSPARDPRDRRREDSRQLRERDRPVRGDVEDAVVQLDRRVVDADRCGRRPPDGVTTGRQRDPTFAGRPDPDRDLDAVPAPGADRSASHGGAIEILEPTRNPAATSRSVGAAGSVVDRQRHAWRGGRGPEPDRPPSRSPRADG